jgi:hypothetical protein
VKNNPLTTSFLLQTLQGEQASFTLDKKKMIIGRHPSCDIQLDQFQISSYHLFVCFLDDGSLLIKDLASESGTYLNGKRIEEAIMFAGDTLAIGDYVFMAEKNEDILVTNADELIPVNEDKPLPKLAVPKATKLLPALPASIPEAPTAPVLKASQIIHSDALPAAPAVAQEVASVAPMATSHLILIDGELCDITYDEKSYRPLDSIPLVNFEAEYTPLEETEESFDLCKPIVAQKFEIISYINGMIQDFQYVDFNDGDFYLRSHAQNDHDIMMSTMGEHKLFSIRAGKVQFYPHPDLQASSSWETLDFNGPIFFTHGAEQISLRLLDKSMQWQKLSSGVREKDFIKQATKIFCALFIPFMLLLFVTQNEYQEPRAEVVVIYQLKKPVEVPTLELSKSELSAVDPASFNENTGSKDENQPVEKVEFASASEATQEIAKSITPDEPAPAPALPSLPEVKKAIAPKIVEKPSAPKVQKKIVSTVVAQSEAKVESTVPASTVPASTAAEPKAEPYQFTSSSLGPLMAVSQVKAAGGTKERGLTKGESFHVGSSAEGDLVAGSTIGVSKLNGSDGSGNGSQSFGSRGLASKKGFDSSYLEPNTVVKGSMDPELLRKILREYIPQFRHCYQQELIGNDDKLAGIVELNFTINAEGKAIKPQISMKNTKFSDKGANCMVDVLNVIEFPKPKGGGVVDVIQPLNFLSETKRL